MKNTELFFFKDDRQWKDEQRNVNKEGFMWDLSSCEDNTEADC